MRAETAIPADGGRPLIVGLGGTSRAESTSERALRAALAAAEQRGAATLTLTADALELPLYSPEDRDRTPRATALVDALRRADGLILAAPGYHGGISGLLKNALDYAEDLRDDARPYLDGRAVGCIVSAAGTQAAAGTLIALRSVIHALRGWPTPLGVTIDSGEQAALPRQLETLACQVLDFAHGRVGLAALRAGAALA